MALLLKHGADTAAVNKQGETALFSACEEAGEEGPSPLALDAVLFLLEQGAGCGIVASDGTTVRCRCPFFAEDDTFLISLVLRRCCTEWPTAPSRRRRDRRTRPKKTRRV